MEQNEEPLLQAPEIQYINEIVQVLKNREMTNKSDYDDFVNNIIPNKKNFINGIKSKLNPRYSASLIKLLEYLEPFLIYFDNLHFNDFKQMYGIVKEQIQRIKQSIGEQRNYFTKWQKMATQKVLYQSFLIEVFKLDFILYFYNIIDGLTDSEIMKRFIGTDYAELVSILIALQNIKIQSVETFDIIEKQIQNLQNIFDEIENTKNDKCLERVIAKEYNSVDDLENDNEKEIFFDKSKDPTRYEIYDEIKNDKSIEEVRDFLRVDVGLTGDYLEEELDAFVNGRRKIKSGQYALLKKEDGSTQLYIRRGDEWIIVDNESSDADEVGDKSMMNKDGNLSSDTNLCNVSEMCAYRDELCNSIQKNQVDMKKEILERLLQETEDNIQRDIEQYTNLLLDLYANQKYYVSKLKNYYKDQNLINSNKKMKLAGEAIKEINVISPFVEIRDLVLGIEDFPEKQKRILDFVNIYTRPYNPTQGENQYMYYCKDTNIPLFPVFLHRLAQAYFQGDYTKVLEQIISKQGKLGDDGEVIVDKYSGYVIRKIDFVHTEGYDEQGYRIVSNDILEEDMNDEFIRNMEKKGIKIGETEQMIQNITNSMSRYIGVNLDDDLEFIIQGVKIFLDKEIPDEKIYNQRLEVAKRQGKRMLSYEFVKNNFLLISTLAYIEISILTKMPSIKTNKTFPNCLRSFIGYPVHSSDNSALEYIACIAVKIRSNNKPWNTILKMTQENLTSKIHTIIEKKLLPLKEIQEKINLKKEYLIMNKDEIIPDEHTIKNWNTFLPPLVPVKIDDIPKLSAKYLDTLEKLIQKGSSKQREGIEFIQGKIIYFCMRLIQEIQSAIQGKDLLLKNALDEPFLENMCCNIGSPNVWQYMTQQNEKLNDIQDTISKYSKILKRYNSLVKASIIYQPKDTKIKYPIVNYEINQVIIQKLISNFCYYYKENQLYDSVCQQHGEDKEESKESENEESKTNEGKDIPYKEFEKVLNEMQKENLISIKLKHTSISQNEEFIGSLKYLNEKTSFERITNEILKFVSKPQKKTIESLYNYIVRANKTNLLEVKAYFDTNSSLNRREINRVYDFLENFNVFKLKGDKKVLSEREETDIFGIRYIKNMMTNIMCIYPLYVMNEKKMVMIIKQLRLSGIHEGDIYKIINKKFEILHKYYGNDKLRNVLESIFRLNMDILKVIQRIPTNINSIVEKETKRRLNISGEIFKYFLYNYILRLKTKTEELSQVYVFDENEVSIVYTQDELENEDRELEMVMGNQANDLEMMSRFLEDLLKMEMESKKVVDTSNKEVLMRVLKLKEEREKRGIIERLQNMTIEERDIENEMKNHRLGDWGLGYTRALFEYDAEQYEKERNENERMVELTRQIEQMEAYNERNADIIRDDVLQEQQRQEFFDKEAYDLSMLANDDDYGNNDGDEYFY